MTETGTEKKAEIKAKATVMTWLKRNGLRFIGIFLLAYVLSGVDWDSLGTVFGSLSTWALIASIPLFLLAFPVRTWRWEYILGIQRIRLPWGKAFGLYTAGVYWGLITPGKLGELIKVFYLTSRGVTTGKAAFGSLLDRGVDVFFLLALGVLGGLKVAGFLTWTWVIVLLVLIMVLFVALFPYLAVVLRKSTPVLTRIAKRFKKNPQGFLEEFEKEFQLFTAPRLIFILFQSLLSWAVYVVPLYWLGTLMQLDIPPLHLITGIILSSAVATVPISIGGLGTRDGFLILFLGQYGIPKEKALLFSLMFLYMYVVALIFSWIVHLLVSTGDPGQIEAAST